MFGSLGGPELVLILVIALIVFGPRRLPDIGKSVGKMLVEFRRASNDFKRTIEDEVESEKRGLNARPGSVTISPGPEAPESAADGAPAPPGSSDDAAPRASDAGPASQAPAPAATAAEPGDEAQPQATGSVARSNGTAAPSERA